MDKKIDGVTARVALDFNRGRRRPPGQARWGALAGAVLLAGAACSPVFNWREVALDGTLSALLPCRPDRAERPLVLGEATVPLHMAGCEAGGATFAIAWMAGGEPALAATRFAAWQAATRHAWRDGALSGGAAVQLRAAEAPAPVELRTAGNADPAAPGTGRPGTEARMRWFAHADARGQLTLYQATVLGHPSAADAADTFFEGLRLP